MTTQSVQVKIELGHKATVRKKRTTDGFTHDWTVFVRGPEGSNIQHFVEKVVMHLHDSFPRPKRVLKEPPYQVTESGYAGFNLPVEIYFKNKEEPRKILFKYDLFLHNEGCPPVNHIRCEKLTFQNPTEEFRRKLIKAGGIGVPGPNDHAQYKPTAAAVTTTITQPAVPHVPPTAEGKAFTDLFGAPLFKQDARKKSKSKDKSSKSKNGTSPTDTPTPSPAPSIQSKPSSSQSKEKSSSNRSSGSVSSASSYKSKTSGAGVIPSKEKATLKRPAESSPSSSDGAKKRRSKDDESIKEHSKDKKHKSSHSHRKSHSSSSKSDKKKVSDTNGEVSSKLSHTKPSQSQNSSEDSSKSKKTVIDLSDGELSSSSSDEDEDDDDDDVVVTEIEASPASSGNKNSFSNGGGPLGKLWDEMEQDEEMLSPLPKSSPSNFFSQLSPTLPTSPEKPKSRTNGTTDLRLNKVSPSDITNQAAPNGETFAMLLDLQRRLLSVTDKELLHKIVRIIQDTELYQISDSTFDFDLCSLDAKTVGKLQNFLSMQA